MQITTITPEKSGSRKQIRQLDTLPLLDRRVIDYDRYFEGTAMSGVKYTMSMLASRGCPYRCIYCDVYRLNKHHFRRSAEHLFEEVKMLNSIGIRRFEFVDDIFNVNIKECVRFFKLIRQHKLDLRLHFPSGLRGDLLVPEVADLMAECGTVHIRVALETASPRLQQMIRKYLDIEKFHKHVDYIARNHPEISIDIFAMFGFPTETEEEALSTLELIRSIHWIDFPLVNTVRVFPGTELEAVALEHGITRAQIEHSMRANFFDHGSGNLVFDDEFSIKFRRKLLKTYVLNRERLMQRLPYQMRCYTEEELDHRYSLYFHSERIKGYRDALKLARIDPSALSGHRCVDKSEVHVPGIGSRLASLFPPRVKDVNAMRILLIDLSNGFGDNTGFDGNWEMTQPIGLMALASYLDAQPFARQVTTRICKSLLDYRNFDELSALVTDYNPHLIGFRALSIHKHFLHENIRHLRNIGIEAPVIVGGPHATSASSEVLADRGVSLTVIGEGEVTLADLVGRMLKKGYCMPPHDELRKISGVAFAPSQPMEQTA